MSPTIHIVFAYSQTQGSLPFKYWVEGGDITNQIWLDDFISNDPGGIDNDIRSFDKHSPDGVYHFTGKAKHSTDWETGYADDVWFEGDVEPLYTLPKEFE